MINIWRVARQYVGPLTAIWAGLCLTFWALSEGLIDLSAAITYAGFLLLFGLLVFTMRDVKVLRRINEAQSQELATVHHLVNSGHDELKEELRQAKALLSQERRSAAS